MHNQKLQFSFNAMKEDVYYNILKEMCWYLFMISSDARIQYILPFYFTFSEEKFCKVPLCLVKENYENTRTCLKILCSLLFIWIRFSDTNH